MIDRTALPSRRWSRAPRSLVRAPAVQVQLLAGLLTGVAMAITEVSIAAARPTNLRVRPFDFAVATLHLTALYVPVGMALSVALAVVAVALTRTPWLEPIRSRLSVRAITRRDPEGVATSLSAFVAVIAAFFAVRWLAAHFTTRYHSLDLGTIALAGSTLLVAVAAVLTAAIVASVLRPIVARLGRSATIAAVLVGALVVLAGGLTALWWLDPQRWHTVFNAFDRYALVWVPCSLASYAAIVVLLQTWLGRRVGKSGRTLPLVVGAFVAAATAFASSAATYGASNRVRTVIEHRTVFGQILIQRYLELTDRDGDGYAAWFGGGDCNDRNRRVHPGAYDAPRDGVDADCFAGDGSPNVAPFGNGHYAALPKGLHRPNLLLVTIDTLRPDHLGCYGYRRRISPRIDAFARNATQFDVVIAPSSRSIRSFPAMFTGFYPSQIVYGPEYLYPSIATENETVAETLRRNGYATAAVLGTDYFERSGHFFQGFDQVEQLPDADRPRHEVVIAARRALDRLSRTEKPWFLWTHFFNVHEPYLRDGVPSKYGTELVDKYDTEINLADKEAGALFDLLGERGLASNTVVVLASDHGEAFGEHGSFGHSRHLYEEEVRAVLLVRVPNGPRRRIRGPVSLIDLTPTLLNFAGIEVPRPIPARSLVSSVLSGTEPDPRRYIFSELMPDGFFPFDQKSIRSNGYKLIWWQREGTVQLFDLRRDRGETEDLSDTQPERAERLLGLLRAWVANTNRPENRHEDVVARNRLRSPPERLSHPLNLRYGDMFTVLGFDMPRNRYRPGDRIPMTFYYRVDSRTRRNFNFVVWFKGPDGYVLPRDFHANHFPMNGRYFTYMWKPGEVLRDPIQIVVPEDIRRPLRLETLFSVHEAGQTIPFEGDGDGDGNAHIADIQIR